jgi:hypothetical protein
MEVQIGKMILYGILSAVFYIVVPLILFEVIASLGYMTFTQAFKTSIIIFGIIGTVISMLRHLEVLLLVCLWVLMLFLSDQFQHS